MKKDIEEKKEVIEQCKTDEELYKLLKLFFYYIYIIL